MSINCQFNFSVFSQIILSLKQLTPASTENFHLKKKKAKIPSSYGGRIFAFGEGEGQK